MIKLFLANSDFLFVGGGGFKSKFGPFVVLITLHWLVAHLVPQAGSHDEGTVVFANMGQSEGRPKNNLNYNIASNNILIYQP